MSPVHVYKQFPQGQTLPKLPAESMEVYYAVYQIVLLPMQPWQ